LCVRACGKRGVELASNYFEKGGVLPVLSEAATLTDLRNNFAVEPLIIDHNDGDPCCHSRPPCEAFHEFERF